MINTQLKKELQMTDGEFEKYLEWSKADIYYAYVKVSKELHKAKEDIKRLNLGLAAKRYDIKKLEDKDK